jgi:hypothetical protein
MKINGNSKQLEGKLKVWFLAEWYNNRVTIPVTNVWRKIHVLNCCVSTDKTKDED